MPLGFPLLKVYSCIPRPSGNYAPSQKNSSASVPGYKNINRTLKLQSLFLNIYTLRRRNYYGKNKSTQSSSKYITHMFFASKCILMEAKDPIPLPSFSFKSFKSNIQLLLNYRPNKILSYFFVSLLNSLWGNWTLLLSLSVYWEKLIINTLLSHV